MVQRLSRKKLSFWLAVWLILLACNMPGFAWQISEQRRLLQTAEALATQQEALRLTQQSQALTPSPLPPTAAPTLTPTPVQATEVAEAPIMPPLPENWRRSARILVFENMSASRYYRYVRDALDWAGYFYVDVGSAKGWFKTQLASPQEWDLIIAAVENHRDYNGVMGALFEDLDQRIQAGSSAIVEFGDFDHAPEGKSAVLLRRCGLELQSDWSEPLPHSFFWLLPAHPLFAQPNVIPARMPRPAPLTAGEIGDLLRVKQGGLPDPAPLLLAGLDPRELNSSGVLAVCLGGQLILQTFPSHDYPREFMVSLWQNYIAHALSHRFSLQPPEVPAPEEQAAATAIPGEPACGGQLSIRLTRPPRYTTALFEHHAQGRFVILQLEISSLGRAPLQVWDDDFRLESAQGGEVRSLGIDKAATGYLYVEGGFDLWQMLLQPGQTWKPRLAFDIPMGDEASWELVVRPGLEFKQPVCEVRIPLSGNP